ncbi:hypothetical protein SARC_07887 [Sphaeroforma arctica JP610]|uniref:Uncharacterized protein n=1 Tax=Sphaeroforma arctica JP610 TaxID=667725 RepID=A0A0L0FSF2_9EUKA|nr:hypothetical protein SARC_07887 [Sphaeroforma arctica JP610]KNC79727.1 hypothetical protein SARC_07887 [Sphaeroforma arctica JP610]|eukprot:XP_014153629.1 hypothetical protein SARC_07887 [Sphaeroforma arctica JP610]
MIITSPKIKGFFGGKPKLQNQYKKLTIGDLKRRLDSENIFYGPLADKTELTELLRVNEIKLEGMLPKPTSTATPSSTTTSTATPSSTTTSTATPSSTTASTATPNSTTASTATPSSTTASTATSSSSSTTTNTSSPPGPISNIIGQRPDETQSSDNPGPHEGPNKITL